MYANADIIFSPIYKNHDRKPLVKICTKLKHVNKYDVQLLATRSMICSEASKKDLLDVNEQSSYHFQKKDLFFDLNPFYIEGIHCRYFRTNVVRLSFNSASFNRSNIPSEEMYSGKWEAISRKYNVQREDVVVKSQSSSSYILLWLGDDYFTEDVAVKESSVVINANPNTNTENYESVLFRVLSKIRTHTVRTILIHYHDTLFVSPQMLLRVSSKFANVRLVPKDFCLRDENKQENIYCVCVLNAVRFVIQATMMGLPVFKLTEEFICFINDFVIKDLSLIADSQRADLISEVGKIDYGRLFDCISEQLFELDNFDTAKFDKMFNHKFLDEILVSCSSTNTAYTTRGVIDKIAFFGHRLKGTRLSTHLSAPFYPVSGESRWVTTPFKLLRDADIETDTRAGESADTLYITVFGSTKVNSRFQRDFDDRMVFLDRDPYLPKFGSLRFSPNVYEMYRLTIRSYSNEFMTKIPTTRNIWRRRMKSLEIPFSESWNVNPDGYILVVLSSMFGIWNGFSRSFDAGDTSWEREHFEMFQRRWVGKATDVIKTIRDHTNREIRIRFHTEILNPPPQVELGRAELDRFITDNRYANVGYDAGEESLYNISSEIYCAVVQHGTSTVQLTISGIPVFCFEEEQDLNHYFCKDIVLTNPKLLLDVRSGLLDEKIRNSFLDYIDSQTFTIEDISSGRMYNKLFNVVNNFNYKIYINDPLNGINHIKTKLRSCIKASGLLEVVDEVGTDDTDTVLFSQCNQNTLSRNMLNGEANRLFVGIDTNPYIQKCIVHDPGKKNAHFISMYGSYNRNKMIQRSHGVGNSNSNSMRDTNGESISVFKHHCNKLNIVPRKVAFNLSPNANILYILNNPIGLWGYDETCSPEENINLWLKTHLSNIESIKDVCSRSIEETVRSADIWIRLHPSTDKDLISDLQRVFQEESQDHCDTESAQRVYIQDFMIPYQDVCNSTICAVMMYGASELQLLMLGVPVINIDRLKRSPYFSGMDCLSVLVNPLDVDLSYVEGYFEAIAQNIHFVDELDNNVFIHDVHRIVNEKRYLE